MNAEIITIGSQLPTPCPGDTNSPYLTEQPKSRWNRSGPLGRTRRLPHPVIAGSSARTAGRVRRSLYAQVERAFRGDPSFYTGFQGHRFNRVQIGRDDCSYLYAVQESSHDYFS